MGFKLIVAETTPTTGGSPAPPLEARTGEDMITTVSRSGSMICGGETHVRP